MTLTVRFGTYSTPVTCGVVRGISVPLLLGTDCTDVHIRNICGPKGYIQLRDGCKVPILLWGKTVSYAREDQPGKAVAASEADAKVRLARQVALPPRSRGYVQVQTLFQGNGVITQRYRMYERHRVHVATGTIDCTANQTWWVEVSHTGNMSKRLPKGMVLGHMSAYSGTVADIFFDRNGLHSVPVRPPRPTRRTPWRSPVFILRTYPRGCGLKCSPYWRSTEPSEVGTRALSRPRSTGSS